MRHQPRWVLPLLVPLLGLLQTAGARGAEGPAPLQPAPAGAQAQAAPCRTSGGAQRERQCVGAGLEAALETARLRGRRPIVGVALSGGGARGLAHIGVLEKLQELGIPVDRVTGTSIGAVIGGLHASGYSPAGIASIMRSLDWRPLFNDAPSWTSLSPLQRERRGRTFIHFGIEDGGLAAGSGLVAGQRLTTLFATLTLAASGHPDFDALPVPFAAIATDIVTGDEVVLRRGPLHQAMRASMAFPLAFTPVEMEGRRLIDGGLSDNLPVEAARQLGAEVVIAVDVSSPLLPPERLRSFVGIAQQIMSYESAASVDEGMARADLGITPDLASYDGADFALAGEIIEQGRRSVDPPGSGLQALAAACRFPDPPPRSGPPADPPGAQSVHRGDAGGGAGPGPVIEEVLIQGGERLRPEVLSRWVRVPTGSPLQAADLEDQIEAIYATGYFESIVPFVEPRAAGGHRLRLELEERRSKQVGFGLRFEDERGPGALFTIDRINLLRRDNSFHVDARAGTVSRLDILYLQPSFPATSFFSRLRLRGSDDFRFVYDDELQRQRYVDRRAVLDLAAGNTVRALGELSLAYRLERINFRPEEDEAGLIGEEFSRLGMFSLRSRIDTLDDPNFPARGRKLSITYDAAREDFSSDADFDRARLEFSTFHSSGRLTGRAGLVLGTAFGGSLPESEKFLLGGPGTLLGLKRAEMRGDEMFALRLGARLALGHLPFIGGGKYYIGGVVDLGNTGVERRDLDRDTRLGGGIELAADTRLGPIRLTGGWSEGGVQTVYFSAGFDF